MIKDYAYAFEEVVVFYFGNPKTPIYFASLHGENIETKAILYTICMHEVNISSRSYSGEELEKLEDFTKNVLKKEEPEKTSYDCIEFLHQKMKH